MRCVVVRLSAIFSAAFASVIGAVVGFFAGVYAASILGLHEAPHVFGLAIPCAAVVSVVAVLLLSWLRALAFPRAQPIFIVVLAVYAFGAVRFFLRSIQVL
jgi:hypothetical protein